MSKEAAPKEISKVEAAKRLIGKNLIRVIDKDFPIRRDRDKAICLLRQLGMTNFILSGLTRLSQQRITKITKKDSGRIPAGAPVTISALRESFAKFYYGTFHFDLEGSLAEELRKRINAFSRDSLRLLDARRKK
jgi:hypothetical protein